MQRIKSKVFDENAYIFESLNGPIIVDPGYALEQIKIVLGKRKPAGILLTHYHFDHVAHVNSLCQFYNIKAYIHAKDYQLLITDNLSERYGFGLVPVFKENIITFQDQIEAFPDVKCIHAPGHSRGSVMYQHGIDLLTGDVLFKHGVGILNLPDSSREEMKTTIEMLKTLPNSLIIYPGHGEAEALVEIKKINPFFR